jgi:hypothetical protein
MKHDYGTTVRLKVAVWVELEPLPAVPETLAFATTVTTCVPNGVTVGRMPEPHPMGPPIIAVPTNSKSSMPRTLAGSDRRRHAMKPPNKPGRKKPAASVAPGVVLFWAMVATPLAVVVMVSVEV